MVRTSSSIIAICALALAFASPAKPNAKVIPAPPVIRTMPSAAEEEYGDWTVSVIKPGLVIASTSNNAGLTFGTLCTGSECVAFFNPLIACSDGDVFNALVNAPASAFAASIRCERLKDISLYTLPLEGEVADAMSVGGVLGIAFPMKSGEFKVARFSLTGAARSTARAQQLARPSAPTRSGGKDAYSL